MNDDARSSDLASRDELDGLRLHAWHGAHHVAHTTSLRRRMGW